MLIVMQTTYYFKPEVPKFFFLATLFPISAHFARPYTINFLIYRLHNVGYILKQEGILQRPTILFIHCKIFSLESATTKFNVMVDGFMKESLVIEYVLCQVHYKIIYYSLPFTVCYFMLISSLFKNIQVTKYAGVNESHLKVETSGQTRK